MTFDTIKNPSPIKPIEFTRILLKSQALTHLLFGIPVVFMLLFSWNTTPAQFYTISLYYIAVLALIYIPFFTILPFILTRRIQTLWQHSTNDQTLDTSLIVKTTQFLHELPDLIRKIIFWTVLCAYLVSSIIFSTPLFAYIAEIQPVLVITTAILGVIISSIESTLNYISFGNKSIALIENMYTHYNYVPRVYPKNIRQSIHTKTYLIFLIISFATMLTLALLFISNVYLYQPHVLDRMIIFTLAVSFINIFFISLITPLFTKSLLNPIEKLKTWAEKASAGKTYERINYITNDETLPVIQNANLLIDEIESKNKQVTNEKNNLNNLISTLDEGIIVAKRSGAVTLINDAAKRIIEVDISLRNVRLSMNLLFRLPNDKINEGYRTWNDLFLTPTENKLLHILTMKGTPRTIRISIRRQKSYDETPNFIITFSDITKDEELEQMKADFVSIAAHELRTPLTSVRNYLSLLEEESASKLSEDEKLYLERTRASVEQLADIMESFLTASKIERNKIELHKTEFEWQNFIHNSYEKVKAYAEEKGIQVDIQLPSQKVLINADQDRLSEVFTNLIQNAAKYTVQGKVNVTSVYDPLSQNISTTITDTGIGIPKEEMSRLFTKFFRASNATQTGIKGTGIGLYVVKTLVELHNGKIWVESELNKGTTFHVILPIK